MYESLALSGLGDGFRLLPIATRCAQCFWLLAKNSLQLRKNCLDISLTCVEVPLVAHAWYVSILST